MSVYHSIVQSRRLKLTYPATNETVSADLLDDEAPESVFQPGDVKIHGESRGNSAPFVMDGNHGLAAERDVGFLQIQAHAFPIGTLQQSWSDGAMNVDGRPDQAVRKCV